MQGRAASIVQFLARDRGRIATEVRSFRYTSVEVVFGGVAVAVAIAIAVGLPVTDMIRKRAEKQTTECQENLVRIEGAKEQWELEHNQVPGAALSIEDLAPADGTGYLKEFPIEPSGGTYRLNKVGDDATCSTNRPGHTRRDYVDPNWVGGVEE